MADLDRYLRRFRPAGAPGAPAGVGVPAERGSGLRSELLPVLERLDPTCTEADAVRHRGEDEARRIRQEGYDLAQGLLDRATESAPQHRARAVAQRMDTAERERADLRSEARAEARRIEAQAARLTPALAERVLEIALGGSGEFPGPRLSPDR